MSLSAPRLGCAKLPNILNCIIPPPNLIPIPKNVSPSEKKSNILHVCTAPLSLKFYAIAIVLAILVNYMWLKKIHERVGLAT